MTDLVNKHLISDVKLIDALTTQFELVSTNNDNWTKTYLDQTKNEKWLSYYVDGALQGDGYNILGRLPLPTTDKLIELALYSSYDDEVFAACRTLTDNEEIRKDDFRLTLIERLENLNNKSRQKKIIELTGLSSALNKQDILGKTTEQINTSANYYKQIADRADKLK
ncbi:MAG: hypothetical protein EOO87_11480 [Pedobacter sp.]|nr:MAG: hypothetical protein EOO87_11480 [Pedobacter sp.]